mgnify:CR=1 FL=1
MASMSSPTPTPDLPFTGERFVPGARGEIWVEHWHRYHFASRFAAGKRVVDAACGEGYGSALLAPLFIVLSFAWGLAVFLLALARRNREAGGDPGRIDLPMTRVDIGDYLGLTIETVSRTFTKLRGDGLIDLAQSVLVTIVDYDALKAFADGRKH